jgi:hypothetical protein
MKKINLLILLIWLTALSANIYAQQESELKRGTIYPGYIVTLNGDTVHGYLLNINLWLNQHQTYFYTDTLDKKNRQKFTPKELIAYQVGSRQYISMKYPFAYSVHKQNFILRKQSGNINLYVWYFDQERAKLSSPDITLVDLSKALLFNEQDLWKNLFGVKSDGKFTELTGLKFLLKFAKNMSAYVADEPELAAKIATKTPGYLGIDRDIEKIIIEYNQLKKNK